MAMEACRNLSWKCYFYLNFTGQKAIHVAKPDINGTGISHCSGGGGGGSVGRAYIIG